MSGSIGAGWADARDTIMRGWFGEGWVRERTAPSPADRDVGAWLRGEGPSDAPKPEIQPDRTPSHDIGIDR